MERRSKRTAFKEGNNDVIEVEDSNAEIDIMGDNEQPSCKKAKKVKKEDGSIEISISTTGKC